MPLLESVFVALFMLSVVFAVLFGLYLAVRCFSFVVRKLDASMNKLN